MEEQKKVVMGQSGSGVNDLSFGMKFINPRAIIDTLEIAAGMSVGDFGAGTGYFTFSVAEKVGQDGIVWAIDILSEKLEAIESQAKLSHLGNILTKRANLESVGGSKLEENSLDWVFLVTMLFQNKNKQLVMDEAARVLRNGGKILVIEWSVADSSFGPAQKLRVPKDEIFEIAQNSDLSVLREIKISDFHYGVILGK